MEKSKQNLDILDSIDPNTVHINTELNEFYAKTNITQYYINESDRVIELILKFPLNSKIQFSKFILELNGKKIESRIIEKEKAKEKYSDAIASGNTGIISTKEKKFIKVNIGNINPRDKVKLTTEFIQFITSEDMSYCYETMSKYPIINNNNNFKTIYGKIAVNTHSKIIRLVTFGLTENVNKEFNELNNLCIISFSLNKHKKSKKDSIQEYIKILFRTASMNNLNCISQYDPINNETSCILSLLYSKKNVQIPSQTEVDTNENINYYDKYQKNIINNNPSLFIFIIDQSGSMSGNPIKLVSKMLEFFLKSLPKNSFFQLIGFGSDFNYINKSPLFYTEENVNKTIRKIEKLKANLGGTNLLLPLKEIFKEDNYKDIINLARNVFILTDGETDCSNECLNIISKNKDKYRIHSFGLGYYYNKKFIKKCGILGMGSYNFVEDISKINSVVIQTLNKSLRSYLYNVKFTLKDLKYEYIYSPINNIVYQDEILNYYFIIKDKLNKNEIKIDFECSEKGQFIKKECIFNNKFILKEKDGDIISKIIIGNILNDEKYNKNITKIKNIEISKKYSVLSEYTSLFAKIENNIPNIDEKGLKQIEYNLYNENNESSIRSENESDRSNGSEENSDSDSEDRKEGGRPYKKEYKKKVSESDEDKSDESEDENESDRSNGSEENSDSDSEDGNERGRPYKKKYKKKVSESDEDKSDESEDENENDCDGYQNKKCKKSKYKKEKCKKRDDKKCKNKNVKNDTDDDLNDFLIKNIAFTQNVIDGYWNFNDQTKLLIESKKNLYDKIEKIIKEKNISYQQNIIITILVLFVLRNSENINTIEYSIIINKGMEFLNNLNINFKEIEKII